jgi:hypothetical protein
VAPGALDPDLARAQPALEGEEHAQLPVVLEEVLVAGGPGGVKIGPPTTRPHETRTNHQGHYSDDPD